MKKFLFLFALAILPVITFSQVSTLATYHNMTDIWLRADENDELLEDRLDSITDGDLVVSAADHVTITDNESTAENNPIVFVEAADQDGGTLGLESDGTFYYTPSTGTVTTTGFTGTTFTIGEAAITETELEILDGATTTTAQLNYLNTATGTTGTNTTNIVYSTSPVLITPALGTPSALVGTNISGTGASFTAGAVTGFTPASGSLTLAGADAVTLTTTNTTNVTLPTTGTLATTAITDLLAPLASPTFTGTATTDVLSVGGVGTFDSTILMGAFGDAQTVLSEASSNTNPALGIYPMVNFEATAGKVFAGAHSRMLAITTNQTNDATMVGMESQFRLKGVNLATGVHAGMWAYAEQSGTSVLSGGGTFDAINATVESASTFTVGATERVSGITLDCSLDAGATMDASANFSAVYIKSNGLDWKTGILIEGVDSIDIQFQNGAWIYNEDSDSLTFVEDNFAFHGNIWLDGAAVSDFAITDEQMPLLDYWAKTQELNRLPAFENKDRRNINTHTAGVEEAAERNLRYIVELEARIRELEAKLK